MRIVHLCEFSSGICGTWNAVFETAKRQAKNHEVYVFSSNIERGTGKIVESREVKEGVKIIRFPLKFSISSNYLFWDFANSLEEIKPDVIHAHVYRHVYTTKAARVAKKLGIPIVMTTHAPFKRKRGLYLGGLTLAYDLFKGRGALKKYNKIIAITEWEQKYLLRLGVTKEQLVTIPNGIPEEFFKEKVNYQNTKTILFLGRLAPLKRIDTLIVAVKDLDVILKLAGPSEGDYGIKMKWLVKKLGIQDKVQFLGPIYDLNKKISLYNNSSIFVLPSESEGMPQSLVEAMSLGKIVLGADNEGIREVIEDGEFLFDVGDHTKLAGQIQEVLDNWDDYKDKMLLNRDKTKGYDWNSIVEKIDKVYEEIT
jgi:glycosyltransferase involved in cell wall biosynthesis